MKDIFKCEYCDKEFHNHQALGGHYKVHKDYVKKKRKYSIFEDKIISVVNELTDLQYANQYAFTIINKEFKCLVCKKIFTKKQSISTHWYRTHTQKGREVAFVKGRKAWNKGLTKETDKRVAKQCETVREGFESGRIVSTSLGRIHSEEYKQQLSIYRKNFLDNNPDKVPYKLNHSSKESWPEKMFREALIKNNISGWIQEFPIKRYSIDFAFVDIKIAFEIDGGTHLLPKVIKKDIERDKYLNSIGWKVIRITAKEIKNNVYECINLVLKSIAT